MPDPDSTTSFDTALANYQRAMAALEQDASKALDALLARDDVEAKRREASLVTADQAQQLITLDARLRQHICSHLPVELANWRQSLQPPSASWWWWLDKEVAEKEEERRSQHSFLWVALATILILLTIPVAIEIIKKLWAEAPDNIAIFGTLLTLVLTSSPLSKQGQDVARWLFQRIPRLSLNARAPAMAMMALVVFGSVLFAQVVLVPALAQYYNDQAVGLQDTNVGEAQRMYQRAIALDPNLAATYWNIGDVYMETGRLDKAKSAFEQAIEQDQNIGYAYRGIGHIYNVQGETEKAELILLAGLDLPYPDTTDKDNPNAAIRCGALTTLPKVENQVVDTLYPCYLLLADLGWSYFAQKRTSEAESALKQSLFLESELKAKHKEEVRLIALPHFYLAKVYDELGQREDATEQWQESLCLLDESYSKDRQDLFIVKGRLSELSPKASYDCQEERK